MSAPDDELVEAVAHAFHLRRAPFSSAWAENVDRIQAGIALSVPALRDALARAAEADVLEDDILRVLQVRNAALLVAAEHIQPGPDGQDCIDREAMIREWVDEGHERVDEYRSEHQRLVLEVIALRQQDAERREIVKGAMAALDVALYPSPGDRDDSEEQR